MHSTIPTYSVMNYLLEVPRLKVPPHYFIPSFGAIENEDLIIADVTNEIF